jgi:hypothetical protein
VIVRFVRVTVGALVVDPIVTTGPPPEILDAWASTPVSLRLLVIVTPPGNVPGPTRIVSPSLAVSTAAWMVE